MRGEKRNGFCLEEKRKVLEIVVFAEVRKIWKKMAGAKGRTQRRGDEN